MYKTVVKDGTGKTEVSQSVAVQAVVGTASGSVTITTDGDAELEAVGKAEGNLIVVADGEVGIITQIEQGDREYYDGTYSVTPNNETQTLSTADKILLSNITVNPIPSNYGLITWNGSFLTVS